MWLYGTLVLGLSHDAWQGGAEPELHTPAGASDGSASAQVTAPPGQLGNKVEALRAEAPDVEAPRDWSAIRKVLLARQNESRADRKAPNRTDSESPLLPSQAKHDAAMEALQTIHKIVEHVKHTWTKSKRSNATKNFALAVQWAAHAQNSTDPFNHAAAMEVLQLDPSAWVGLPVLQAGNLTDPLLVPGGQNVTDPVLLAAAKHRAEMLVLSNGTALDAGWLDEIPGVSDAIPVVGSGALPSNASSATPAEGTSGDALEHVQTYLKTPLANETSLLEALESDKSGGPRTIINRIVDTIKKKDSDWEQAKSVTSINMGKAAESDVKFVIESLYFAISALNHAVDKDIKQSGRGGAGAPPALRALETEVEADQTLSGAYSSMNSGGAGSVNQKTDKGIQAAMGRTAQQGITARQRVAFLVAMEVGGAEKADMQTMDTEMEQGRQSEMQAIEGNITSGTGGQQSLKDDADAEIQNATDELGTWKGEVRDTLAAEQLAFKEAVKTKNDYLNTQANELYAVERSDGKPTMKMIANQIDDQAIHWAKKYAENKEKLNSYASMQIYALQLLQDMLDLSSEQQMREVRSSGKQQARLLKRFKKLARSAQRVSRKQVRRKKERALKDAKLFTKTASHILGSAEGDIGDGEELAEETFEMLQEMWSGIVGTAEADVERTAQQAGKYDQLRKDLVMGGVEIMSGVKTRTTEVDMALERELKAYQKWWKQAQEDAEPQVEALVHNAAHMVQTASKHSSGTYEAALDLALGDKIRKVHEMRDTSLKAFEKALTLTRDTRDKSLDLATALDRTRFGYERLASQVKAEMKMPSVKKNHLRRLEQARNEFAQMDQAVLQASNLQEQMQIDIQQALHMTSMDLNDTMFTELVKLQLNADADAAELNKKLQKTDRELAVAEMAVDTKLTGLATHLGGTVDDIEEFRGETNKKTNTEHNRVRTEQTQIAEKTGTLVHDVSTRVKQNLKDFRNDVSDAIDSARGRLDSMDEQVAGLEDRAQRGSEGVRATVHREAERQAARSQAARERAERIREDWGKAKAETQGSVKAVQLSSQNVMRRTRSVQAELDAAVEKLGTDLRAQVDAVNQPAFDVLPSADNWKEQVKQKIGPVAQQSASSVLRKINEFKSTAEAAGEVFHEYDDKMHALDKQVDQGLHKASAQLQELQDGVAADRKSVVQQSEEASAAAVAQQQLATSRGNAIGVMLDRAGASASSALTSQAGAALQQAEADSQKLGSDAGHVRASWGDDVAGKAQLEREMEEMHTAAQLQGQELEGSVNGARGAEEHLATDLSAAADGVEGFDLAAATSENKAASSEGTALLGAADEASKMALAMNGIQSYFNRLLNTLETGTEEGLNNTRDHVNDIQHGTAKLVSAVLHEVNNVRERWAEHRDALNRALNASETTRIQKEFSDQLEQAATHLQREAGDLKRDRGLFQGLVQRGVTTVAREARKAVDDIVGSVNASEAGAKAQQLRHKDFETRQEKFANLEISFSSQAVKRLAAEAAQLDAQHTDLQLWGTKMGANSEAYQEVVAAKLRELGVKVPGIEPTGVAAFGADANSTASALLAEQSNEFDTRLADTMKKADGKIAELMKDERLTEEEREEAIRKVKEEAALDAEKIIAEQQQAAHAEEMVAKAANRYDEMSAAAMNATDAALSAGHLSPEAVALHHRLQAAADDLKKVSVAPWLSSSLQLRSGSDEPDPQAQEGLGETNEELKEANAELRSRIQKLERLLPSGAAF